MKLITAMIFLIILTSGCISQSNKIDEKYCTTDQDCECGVKIDTKECFYGNKKYVDTKQQCPDFCTGIGGNLEIKCINNQCTQVTVSR